GTGYVFDENGVFLAEYNGLYEDGDDTYWVENGKVVVFAGLVKVVDENGHIDYYYFDETNKAVKDGLYQVVKTNDLLPEGTYEFDADGKMIFRKNGIIEEDGELYYYVDDVRTYAGLILLDGNYYYVRSNGALVRGQKYWVTKTNGLMPEGSYEFDADGKMIFKKNGIIEEDGELYYYVDDVRTYAGLILIDGNYYYVRSNGALVRGQKYWVTRTNGYVEEGSYYFDEDGKMVIEKANGIVEEDGELYYYEDGVRVYAGLILIDGDYYYVRSNGALVRNQNYWVTKTNDLLPEGIYTFGEDGKMIQGEEPEVPVEPQEPINGIVEEDGELYYYEDGVRVYAGLIQIDGDYYYVRSNGALVRNRSYWVTKTNDLLPEGIYTFGEDGKMILDEEPVEPEEPEIPEEPVEPEN
ncbi:MAG: hypothetical protein J1E00_07655, partial [Oscillospiraceae bacterium]|nr:hypothetical protein [Oscillospiraceae bacterium]